MHNGWFQKDKHKNLSPRSQKRLTNLHLNRQKIRHILPAVFKENSTVLDIVRLPLGESSAS